jgi:S-disulfanyl-L-cysteine oxidoreductase SoxD
MSMSKPLAAALLAGLLYGVGAAGAADTPNLGRSISEEDIKPWAITILPDGTNLPPGGGTAAKGAVVFADKCAACHGEGGRGAANAALITDLPLRKGVIEATKTIANFYANSTTLFDYIRRAMPWPAPRTLTDDQVYSLVAYILAGNKIVGENDVMNAETLPTVKMPNREHFIVAFPDKI